MRQIACPCRCASGQPPSIDLRMRRSDGCTVALSEALHWCYSREEFHVRQPTSTFYADRSASIDGETEAGSIYARGLVTHSLVPAAELETVLPGQMLRTGSGTRRGGGITIVTPALVDIRGKALADLPMPNRAERHGRDALHTSRTPATEAPSTGRPEFGQRTTDATATPTAANNRLPSPGRCVSYHAVASSRSTMAPTTNRTCEAISRNGGPSVHERCPSSRIQPCRPRRSAHGG